MTLRLLTHFKSPAKPQEPVRFQGSQASQGKAGSLVSVRLQEPLMRDMVLFSGNKPPSDNEDVKRWVDILKGNARKDLEGFKSPSNYEKTEDGQAVRVPEDYIDLPRFMRGSNEGGTGQGQGQPGDEVGEVGQDGQPQPGQGNGEAQSGQAPGKPGEGQPGEEGEGEGEGDQAGEGSGELKREDWSPTISRFEVAQWIGDGLELPNFEPRGKNNIQKIIEIWDSLRKVGTPGSIQRRKTFDQMMRRSMAEQGIDFKINSMQWRNADFRYLDTTERPIPKENAVIIYILDTSGSMSAAKKKMARDTNFYLSTYIQARYGEINAEYRGDKATEDDFGTGVQEEFIIHDDDADVLVSDEQGTAEHKFYTTSKSGGTKFVPAIKKVQELIETKYPLDEWNVYVFHYTDGDAFGDEKDAVKILQELVKQGLNLYGFIQTEGRNQAYESLLNRLFGQDNDYVRKVQIKKDSPQECRKAVHAMLGTEETRQKLDLD